MSQGDGGESEGASTTGKPTDSGLPAPAPETNPVVVDLTKTPRVTDFIDLTDDPAISEYSPGLRTPDEKREDTRTFLAIALAGLLGIIVIGSGAGVMIWPDRIAVFEKFLTIVFAPILGLVGTVSGFYFGEKSAERKQQQTK